MMRMVSHIVGGEIMMHLKTVKRLYDTIFDLNVGDCDIKMVRYFKFLVMNL